MIRDRTVQKHFETCLHSLYCPPTSPCEIVAAAPTGPARRGRSYCVPNSYYTIHFCLFSVIIVGVNVTIREQNIIKLLTFSGWDYPWGRYRLYHLFLLQVHHHMIVTYISVRIFFNHREFQFENDVNSESPSVSSLYYGRRTDTSTSVPTTPTPRYKKQRNNLTNNQTRK